MNHNHKSAFTLIELLVVIAIIAILAAILFPVFAQAKLAAKKAQSLSNMKNITLGAKLYEGDYDDNIPVAQWCEVIQTAANNSTLHTWQDEIYPYIKAGFHVGDVAHGTGNGSDVRNTASGIFADPGAPSNQSFPYGIHRDLSPDNWGSTCPGGASGIAAPSISETSVDTPADKALFILKGQTNTPTLAVDPASGWGWIYFITDEWAWTPGVGPFVNGLPSHDNATGSDAVDCDGKLRDSTLTGYSWNDCGMHPRFRYSGVSNFGFLDGHAKGLHKGGDPWFKTIYIQGLTAGLW